MKLLKASLRSFHPIYFQVNFIFSLSILWMLPVLTVCAPTNITDKFALFKFKESITIDPQGVLRMWNDSINFCNWFGVTCSSRHQRVIALDLQGCKLHGPLSPYIGNLSFLRSMNLQNNSLYGQIPEEVGLLFRLQELVLANNTFKGNILSSLVNCSKLRVVDLSWNEFAGTIPVQLGSSTKLMKLSLATNNLTGGLPPSLGNISSLKYFSAANNNLEGIIPDDIGRLKNLCFFSVGGNKLSGVVPSSLYNISSLEDFLITGNQLIGTLPEYIGFTLPNLHVLELSINQLSGSIPISLTNISGLQLIDFSYNNFERSVPTNLGNLQDLWWVGLANNLLGSNSSKDFDFLTSLVNCSKLEVLILSSNNLGGVLPQTIGNLSTQLQELYLGSNKISGSIPVEIGNLNNLALLTIDENLFTGIIPTSFGNFQNMQVMSLSRNRLSGQIPSSIGNLTKLILLYLYNNRLEGIIPSSMGNFRNLQCLDISQNNLSGVIPPEVIGLSSLSQLLKLSRNSLNGSLPREVGNLKNINSLDLSENNMSGEIPETIGECESLEHLYLQGNSFQGNIPPSLASLRGLQVLDISRNNLSGEIPKGLEIFPSSVYLNFSFNNLEGEVPKGGVFRNSSAISVTGNSLLCGGVQELHLPPCPAKVMDQSKSQARKLVIIIAFVIIFIIVLSTSFSIYWTKRSKNSYPISSTVEDLSLVSYRRLHQATSGFSPNNLIGSGGFGFVYKGIFDPEERVVAIKVLDVQKKGASKSFVAECNALKCLRHRNLVKVLTCCSSIDYKGNDFKALIFEFMLNGSLEKWIHLRQGENQSLNLLQRLNIIIDVASALHYLHFECDQLVIHCDLKPSNILLDSDMVAHVSDFGLARLLSPTNQVRHNQTSTIGLKGTVGYVAPEYGMGGEASMQGDVYSFGIIILEIFTGKRPTHEMFVDGLNLHNYIKAALPQNLVEIIDPVLLQREAQVTAENNMNNNYREEIRGKRGSNNINQSHIQIDGKMQKCLQSVLEVGLACSMESPNERIAMGVVIRDLHLIRNAFFSL